MKKLTAEELQARVSKAASLMGRLGQMKTPRSLEALSEMGKKGAAIRWANRKIRKLNKKQEKEICRKYASKTYSMWKLAVEYKVSPARISSIIHALDNNI